MEAGGCCTLERMLVLQRQNTEFEGVLRLHDIRTGFVHEGRLPDIHTGFGVCVRLLDIHTVPVEVDHLRGRRTDAAMVQGVGAHMVLVKDGLEDVRMVFAEVACLHIHREALACAH